MRLSAIPDEVTDAVRRHIALVARAEAGEYGDIPPDKMRAIRRLDAKARRLDSAIREINKGVILINGAADGNVWSLAESAIKDGDADLAVAITLVAKFSEDVIKESGKFASEMRMVHDEMERGLAGDSSQ
jgi:hypothetical protein